MRTQKLSEENKERKRISVTLWSCPLCGSVKVNGDVLGWAVTHLLTHGCQHKQFRSLREIEAVQDTIGVQQ